MKVTKTDETKLKQASSLKMPDSEQEVGLALSKRQGWLMVVVVLLFFLIMLFFGYKDWQRQQGFTFDVQEAHL